GVLADVDPDRASLYRHRASVLGDRLAALANALDPRFERVRNLPFVSAHRAYGHLEARFALTGLGALTRSDESLPTARGVGDMYSLIRERNVRCVFTEPHYQPRAVMALARDTGARTVLLDPLGGAVPEGPDQYFILMETLAGQMIGCLAETRD
ncbi:MAG: zinc ABC transporter substrate-binding protein, partial [Sphingomonadales bacterium]